MKALKSCFLASLLISFCLCEMTQSPFQYQISHRLINQLLKSAGHNLMQVLDNSKVKQFNIDREDFNLTVTDLVLDSDQESNYPFQIEYIPVVDKNELILQARSEQFIKFKGTAKVTDDHLSENDERATLIINGKVRQARMVLDMAHYKPIGKAH